MPKKATTALLLLPATIVFLGAQGNQDFSRELAYRGSKLEGEVYLCTSDHVTSAGFRRDASSGKVTEVVEVSKERNTTTWRTTLKRRQAEVVAFTGTTQRLEAAQQFAVIRGPAGLVLMRNDGRSSTQTITIDSSNSSFVYSGQDMNLLMNKTNIFVGSCRPYL